MHGSMRDMSSLCCLPQVPKTCTDIARNTRYLRCFLPAIVCGKVTNQYNGARSLTSGYAKVEPDLAYIIQKDQ